MVRTEAVRVEHGHLQRAARVGAAEHEQHLTFRGKAE